VSRRGPEGHGVEAIPEEERTSPPSEFAWVWHAAQFSFGTVVLGALPVVFGLSWWASVAAIVVGATAGGLLIASLVRFGLRTATNDPISSGAHFGVRGRVLGSLITILVGLGFFSIATWTGGTAMMVACARLFGTPTGKGALAVAMPAVALVVILIAVWGHGVLVSTYKVTTVLGAVVLLVMVLVLSPRFDAGYAGGAYALGGFWPTWLLAAAVATSVPMSYATFQGDYSRYIKGTDRQVMAWSTGSLILSCVLALTAGAYVTVLFADVQEPWLQGLIEVVPAWFGVVVVIFGFVGSFPQGALCLYAVGLSANSIFHRASRPVVTVGVSLVAVAVLYVGAVVYDAMDSIAAFVTVLLSFVAPWAGVMTVGFALRGGSYDRRELHRLSAVDGLYWYRGGYNPRAMLAFAAGMAVGLASTSTVLFTGPVARLLGGVDLGYLFAFTVAGAVYYAACKLYPEFGAAPVPVVERPRTPV
jgi:purine-cytosine permease-like protein